MTMQPQVTVPLYAAVLGLFCTALSQRPVAFSPFDHDGVFFSVAIPTITASSGFGPNFFQIKAPSTLHDVTLSPRSGKGHFQPAPNLNCRVSLLGGSGIQDGMMTANVLCENCNDWQGGSMDPKSPSTRWIHAYKEGSLLNFDNVTEFIQKHDGQGGASADLSHTKTASTNPFSTYNASTDSSDTTSSTDGTGVPDMLIAHRLMMATAFILLFPPLALIVLLPFAISISKVHAPLQVLALALTISRLGNLMMNSHPIIGVTVVVLLTPFQPAMGFFQHRHLRRDGGKSVFAYAHRWLGRSMIVLGTINGGLGFYLAGIGNPGAPQSAMIVYSIIAGVVGWYILAYIFWWGYKEDLIDKSGSANLLPPDC
ncbi:cellobiose dehydrogenase [Aspergillus arachidicola]|uniref:Cellobiose dehydrogenase n=1 Tax=Aspergillus arachidicola TaxID=656916 RepID=A0A2G7G8V9_9EURO|nr:cellobiose dehydrogenase [Aspergillus arachidicola]